MAGKLNSTGAGLTRREPLRVRPIHTFVLVLLIAAAMMSGSVFAQTSPTNFNLSTEAAAPTDIDGVPGYGANYGAGNTYDLRFGRINAGTPAQTPVIESFEVGPDLFVAVPRGVPTPYDRVIVNRRATPAVDNLNKFTGFFSNNGLVGGVADGSEVFYQSEFIGTLEGIINSYDIDRGADNVFANAVTVATKNNVQRIDMIIDDPLIVGAGALARTGVLLLERGGNDQVTLAAITSVDPVTGAVTGLGPLVKSAGPLGAIWSSTGVSRATTVFQNADTTGGFQDIRPDQNLGSQAISGTYISLANLGIGAGQPMYGLALFGNDVIATMDLLGLSDFPLDTDGTANGGLDLMGGGGFFFSAGLDLVKQADVATYAAVGDEIEYSFTVTNVSGVTLTDVQVTDPMLGGVIACVPSTLLAGDSASCGPVTYVVTQADIDAGQIINVAQATGLDPDDEPVFGIDNEIVDGPPLVPGLDVEKLLTAIPSPVFAGDLLEFTITATNTGNATLTDVVVNDPLLTPDTELCPTLAPMATCVLTGSYTVTQADIDAGQFVNLATAQAPDPTDPDGPPLEEEDEVTTPIEHSPALVLEKLITAGNPYAVVGDVISYELTATNTGNVTLSNVTISDPDVAALVCAPVQPATLAPAESLVCTGSYTVGQGDIDTGSFTNTATANGEGPGGEPVSDDDDATADGPAGAPALVVVKALTDAPDPIVVGSLLQYTVTATNTGNITLANVVVSDSLITPDSILCPIVAVGTDCVLVGTYTVTQADIDAGQILNTGAVQAPDPTDPDNPPLEEEDEVTTPLPQDPALVLEKIITAGNPYAVVGDVISYQLTATNTGNVTLSNVTISDPDVAALVCAPAQPATLAPTESLVCTGSYTVGQGDIDAGSFTNTATANGEGPGGEPVSDDDDATADGPAGAPGLSVVKALTDAPDPIIVGSVLQYTVTATNTGNITLTNVLVTDNLITPDSINCPSVAVGATCVLVGTYAVTQADIDAGQILNIGAAQAPDPTDPDNPPLEEEDEVTTPLPQDPALVLEKIITAGNPYAAIGDVISYQLTATNTGNVTLSNVTISDPDVAALVCAPAQPATLAPTESLVCTGSYTVEQGDIDAGSFTNTATANGEGPGGEPVSDDDDATADGPAGAPGLSVVKALTDAPDPIIVGSVLQYTVTATNNGNITLTDVVVSDTLITPDTITCPTVTVGNDCVLVGTYTVTQADIDAGEILNTGAAQAPDPTDPDNPPLQDDDDVTTPIEQTPALVLDKVITAGNPYAAIGDVISYQLTATNTGNVTLSNVTISDPDVAALVCAPVQPATLAPTEILVCTGSYTVEQGDIDAGSFTNTATANGEGPGGEPVSDDDEATADGPAAGPALAVVKALTDAPDPIEVGSVLQYTVTATNTGNVTLADVVVTDTLITPDTITCPSVAVGDDCVLVGTYTVTQADIDAGQILNTGAAQAPDPTDPDNPPLQDDDDVTTPIEQTPALVLDKVITAGNPYAAIGDVISYQLTATNTGNVTLSNVTISDPEVPALVCAPAQPATLAPTETLVCTGNYTVGQGDIDAGSFTNTATANGEGPGGEPVSDDDEATADGPAAGPALAVFKALTDAPDPIVLGSVLQYTVTTTNTGNVTLTDVVVSDSLITPDSITCPSVLVGDDCVLVGTYTVTQSDIDAGQIVNTATGDSNETEPEDDTVTTPVQTSASLALVKSMVNANPSPVALGSVLTYVITATNTGQAALTDVLIIDSMITPDTITCPLVLPGDTCVLTGTYTVTQADVTAGQIQNIAIASGQDPGGNPVPDVDSEVTTPVGPSGASPAQPVPGLNGIALWLLMALFGTIAHLRLRSRVTGH